MLILGINAYHDGASACLLLDGRIVAAAEEERFTRLKYCAGFPTEAVRYCLRQAGATLADLDHVGISRDPTAHLPQKLLFALRRRPSPSLVRDRLANAARVRDPRRALLRALDADPARLRARFHSIEHHRCHLASAFFVSPFDQAAVLSVDGMGDFVSTMWAVGRVSRIQVLGSVGFPHSLGIFYTAVTQWLGFLKYGDEGKVMSLPAFGQPRYLDQMRRIVQVQPDGTFRLDLRAFVHHRGGASMTWDAGTPRLGLLYAPEFVARFGPPRAPGDRGGDGPLPGFTQHHLDVAASLQAMLEEAELALVRRLERDSGQRALCLAGGVALNSLFNG